MPMYDLNSDSRDTDNLRLELGGQSHVVIYIDGEKVADRHLQKAQRVSVHFADESEEVA